MIEIQNDRGQYLNLYPGATLENELNSWLLSDDDSLLGSYSLPFKFPIRSNESFISHKHRIEAGYASISVTVAANGLPMGAAALVFRIDNGAADGVLKFASGAVAAKLRSKYLYEVVASEEWTLCRDPEELPAAMLKTVDPLTNPYPFVFFPLLNPEFTVPDYEEKNALIGYQHGNYVNMFTHLLGAQGRFVVDTATAIGFPVVPFFYLEWLIQKVCTYLGFSTEGNWLQNVDIKRLVLYNNVAIDTKEGFFKTCRVSAKYHVWDMKLADFFRYLRNDLGVGVFFDNYAQKIIFYTYTELAAADNRLDLSDSLLEGHTSEFATDGGLSIRFPTDDTDDFSKEQSGTEAYQIGEGINEVPLTIGTLPMTNTQGSLFSQSWLVPVTKQRGISLDERYKGMGIYSVEVPLRNAPAPKLLMYMGMQPGRAGKLYPLGSSISTNAKQEKVAGMSLLPDAPDSLFHQYVRPFYEFKAFTKKITFSFFMKLSQALRLSMWQSLYIGSADMVTLPYLIQQFTYQLPAIDGKVLAKLSVWPMLPLPEGYTPKVQGNFIWVRAGFYVVTGGFFQNGAGAFSVKFELFAYPDASLIATTVKDITIFYSYTTRGYNTGSDTIIEEIFNLSIVCPAGQSSVSLPVPAEFWTLDDPTVQYQNPNLYYIVKSSFKVLYSSAYLIIY